MLGKAIHQRDGKRVNPWIYEGKPRFDRSREDRRQETKSEEKGRYRSEFSYGAFSRSVRLPAGTSEEDVKATYRDGILEIRFPIDSDREAARKGPVTRD